MEVRFNGVSVAIEGVEIVHGVSLEAADGEVVGVLGPNGSGKSTLLRTLYRALKPRAGAVLVGDADVWAELSAREAARRTAAVTQHSEEDFRLSVLEVVLMGRTPHKSLFSATTAEDHAFARGALEQVGMAEAADRLYPTLSGGEQQRVVLARALCQQAKVLVLDEPTNHLDIAHQLEFLELVRRLDNTAVLVLHDLNLAATYCDRVFLLAQGRIVAAGPVTEVLTPELVRAVFGVCARLGTHPVTGAPQLSFSPLESDPLESQRSEDG
ncbi:ABC transporter ATP-binding protein [Amycolatopsis anabasis]|uniref:ABC transporter ATP-binding protein n=1 Tax=Amycolatopsis anabasis TaxID=1840409 RepID=UPI00131D7C5C|nr:ABC transporter ATP-binding protein [Amycolatopsis anabasis]